MSKSPNIFGPALGVTGIVLGVAVALPTLNAREQAEASAADRVSQAEARAAEIAAIAEAEVAAAMAAKDEAKAAAEAQVAEAEAATAAAEAAAAAQLAMAVSGSSDQAMPMMQQAAASRDGGFGLGRAALPEEVAAWDIDVRPDGLGLPEGEGDVWTGEEVFVENCSACHGDFGEAVGRWPVLAGGWDTLDHEDPEKTIGSYWPYLSTVFDYINRAMPYGNAQSLEPDEVYAITAYLLYVNNLVDDDFVLSNENFLEVPLPNEGGFFMDDRAETEYAIWSNSADVCMTDCKPSVEITMRAMVLDVTPETEGDEEAAAEETPVEAEVVEAAATEEAPAEEMTAAIDPALVEDGARVFRACQACHKIGEGARNGTGPHLNGVVGRAIGGVEDFRYSNVMQDAGGAGRTWTSEELSAFLMDPRGTFRGTKMAYNGLRSEDDLAAILAYLEAEGG